MPAPEILERDIPPKGVCPEAESLRRRPVIPPPAIAIPIADGGDGLPETAAIRPTAEMHLRAMERCGYGLDALARGRGSCTWADLFYILGGEAADRIMAAAANTPAGALKPREAAQLCFTMLVQRRA